jgi:hypothetical protein
LNSIIVTKTTFCNIRRFLVKILVFRSLISVLYLCILLFNCGANDSMVRTVLLISVQLDLKCFDSFQNTSDYGFNCVIYVCRNHQFSTEKIGKRNFLVPLFTVRLVYLRHISPISVWFSNKVSLAIDLVYVANESVTANSQC